MQPAASTRRLAATIRHLLGPRTVPLGRLRTGPVTDHDAPGTLHADDRPQRRRAMSPDCHFEYGHAAPPTAWAAILLPRPSSSAAGFELLDADRSQRPDLEPARRSTTYHYRVVAANANGRQVRQRPDLHPGPRSVGLEHRPGDRASPKRARPSTVPDRRRHADPLLLRMGPDHAPTATPARPAGHRRRLPGQARAARRCPLRPQRRSSRSAPTTPGRRHQRGRHQLRRGPGVHDSARHPSIRQARRREVHSDRAVLHGEVNPNGRRHHYHFEYVDDAHFQESGFADAAEAPVSESTSA